LLEELKIEMTRLGVEYRNFQVPLRIFWVGQKMTKDETLTELAFLQTALRVRSAYSLCVNVVQKYKKTHSLQTSENRLQ
jgi:hypothetical protein